jgi:hypothetical protein
MYTECYKGTLGPHDIARVKSNRARDCWTLDLKVPGYRTAAVVRYLSLEEAQGAAEDLLQSWMRDVGMQWAPRRDQVRKGAQWGIRYDFLIKGSVDVMESQVEAERRLAADPERYSNGEVVRQEISIVSADWEPVL